MNMTEKQLGSIVLFLVGSNAKPVDWAAIVAEVERSGFEGNFMRVRGAVQALINGGFIERVKDVHTERYRLKA